MKKRFPAWDERDGYTITVRANSKTQAIRFARREMEDAGNCGPGCGPASFSAKELDISADRNTADSN
jgi:hypothetical protein